MRETRHRFAWRLGRGAPLRARRRGGGIETRVNAGFVALALTGMAWSQPAAAAVCRVPAALLCEGCVERLSIRVAADGRCRVSFSPATASEQTATAKFVDINVEAEAPRATIHRVSAPHLSVARHAIPLRISPACFVFNGRRFCE
jgi:hypothetical protein